MTAGAILALQGMRIFQEIIYLEKYLIQVRIFLSILD